MTGRKTLAERIEKAPTPILVWDMPGDRLWKVLWQYVFIFSLLTTGAAFATFFVTSAVVLPIVLWVVSGIGLTSSTIGFGTLYLSDDYYRLRRGGMNGKESKQRIASNIHTAARRSLDKENSKAVNLSDYVHLRTFATSADEDYLKSLSNRHIKWAKKYYAKSIEGIRYANTDGKRKQDELLREHVSALDEASNEKRIRELTYELDALKSLGQNPPLTEREKMEREFADL